MKVEDQERFAKMMLALGELYVKEVSPTMIALYFRALSEYELSDISRAANLHVKNPDNGQFFPKPADIVRLIGGSSETRGLQAWSIAREAVKRVGRWRSVCFDDPIIHLVIDEMGGWPKLCEMKETEEPFIAKDFEKRYRGHFSQGKPASFPAFLIGVADQSNGSKYGINFADIALIGDREGANNVLSLGVAGKPKVAISLARASDSVRYLTMNKEQ